MQFVSLPIKSDVVSGNKDQTAGLVINPTIMKGHTQSTKLSFVSSAISMFNRGFERT